MSNIYKNLPDASKQEIFETLIKNPHFKLERITSKGQATPADEWLESNIDEWVMLLQGHATLVFDEQENQLEMNPGDYLLIPAKTRHRVERTDKEGESIWLALHYQPNFK